MTRARPHHAFLFFAALAATAPGAGPLAVDAVAREAEPVPGDPALRKSLKSALFDQLRAATTQQEADAIADQIWRIWMVGPDDAATDLMARAMERRGVYDFAGAHEILDELVERYPEWSEPWNQRAYIRFLQERYDRSLEDIDETLSREPMHFGALSGRALVLMRQGRIKLGQKALRDALEVHPWARERAMLIPTPDAPAPPLNGAPQTEGQSL